MSGNSNFSQYIAAASKNLQLYIVYKFRFPTAPFVSLSTSQKPYKTIELPGHIMYNDTVLLRRLNIWNDCKNNDITIF